MKKTILSLFLAGIFGVAMAQKSEVNTAKNEYAKFELGLQVKTDAAKQLATLNTAKASADKAITNEKTKNDPELWAYRAVIYSALAVTDTTNQANSEAAFKTSSEAIAKAKTLDTKGEQKGRIENAEKNLSVIMQNKGVKAFNSNDFKNAYTSFKYVADVYPSDSTFNMYTAMAANQSQQYDEAIKYFNKTIELNDKNPGVYQELAKVHMLKKDTTAALAAIDKGRAKHPSNLNLIYEELNVYLNRNQADKVLDKIDNAIAKDPKNKNLYYVSGIANETAKKFPEAETAYKKAIEIDPAYFDATYNLGVYYINRGNDFINQANKLPNSKEANAKYNALKGKFDGEIAKAVPLLEKAHEINPKDKNTLVSLSELYVKTNKLDKAAEAKKKLAEL